MSSLVFFINGHKIREEYVDPECTLITYLRNKLRLCGTKSGCGEGGCGACTVMISRYDRTNNRILNRAVNACLIPVCSLHGTAITTVEGIGSISSGLHPVQERIAKSHGSQCGFCTPGIVMSMYTLLRNKALPSMEDIEKAFEGNLCRCTGYRPILEGFRTLSSEWCCGMTKSGNCCQNDTIINNGLSHTEPQENQENTELFSPSSFKPYDPSQDPIFPPELMVSSEYDGESLLFQNERLLWRRPVTLESLLELKSLNPEAQIVVGNTNIGIQTKFKNVSYPVVIQATNILELRRIIVNDENVSFGASCTLIELEEFLLDQINTKEERKTRVFAALVEMLRWFAGTQIRNVASIAGSIMTGSDLNPIFIAAQCKLQIMSKGETRMITIDDEFTQSNSLKSGEILTAILIPYSCENEFICGFKQGKRRNVDSAIVNAGMFVTIKKGNMISSARLAFGRTGEATVLAHTFTNSIVGTQWNENVLEKAPEKLLQDFPATDEISVLEFRKSLLLSFFFKFYLIVSGKLEKVNVSGEDPIPRTYKSATDLYQRIETKSFQLSQILPEGQPDYDLVSRPFPHLSALKQATGEAVYIDDMPRFENELYLVLLLSERAHAKIISIDATRALAIDGIVDFLSAKDVPDNCNFLEDEQVFAKDTVTCVGQVVGAIIGTDRSIAKRALKLVKVEYEDIQPLCPLILTIEDAIANKSFYHDCLKEISKGDTENGFRESADIIQGEMHIGGQEHFYLETHVSIAVPKLEDGEIEIFCSTQDPSGVQAMIAHVLELPLNRVVIKTKRLGGGFGGKESQAGIITMPVAIAAQKHKRPVRCMLDRDEDMMCTGKRHPFFCQYRVGYMKDGKIVALKMSLYSNAGHTLDLSDSVMEAALLASDNAYNIPNLSFSGILCKTNLPSNTAFRGFGMPQGMMFCENIIQHVADTLNMDPVKLREKNMYKEGDTTHYNQILERCSLRRCWEECLTKSEYTRRREEVLAYNSENRWRKRGLALIPTKFGIAFFPRFMNQAGSLVLVYKDGSVLISHGGCEMGQGLHTKMIQIATRVLQISSEKIRIAETSTDKVPNTSPTAASTSSDLNGMAVLDACQIIMKRLEPIKESNPEGKWEDWISTAYFERINLSATGFYKTPGVGYDMASKSGTPHNYFCFGAACSEVEIDCLTGDHKVRRTDIVMDVGESLNPAIDIGQIEGGFTQGYGLFVLEDLQFSSEGSLLTKGPGTYKIPSFGDIPAEFNVSLLRGAPNPKAVFSSKAVGEPPLFLAASVFFAIKEAIKSARNEIERTQTFRLDSPATSQRIRRLCADQFTKVTVAGESRKKEIIDVNDII